jgi:hypothetical protein
MQRLTAFFTSLAVLASLTINIAGDLVYIRGVQGTRTFYSAYDNMDAWEARRAALVDHTLDVFRIDLAKAKQAPEGKTAYATLHEPATGWRGKYFLSLTSGVTTVASHMIALAAAGTNHRTACRRCSRYYKVCEKHRCKRSNYIFEESVSWDIRLFVWSKFHFFCGIAVPRTQTTAFSC